MSTNPGNEWEVRAAITHDDFILMERDADVWRDRAMFKSELLALRVAELLREHREYP